MCRCSVAGRSPRADFGFHSPSIKEKLVEVIQPLPQDCTQQRLAGEMVKIAVPPIKEELAEASASRAPPQAHRRADSGMPRTTEQRGNHGSGSGSVSRAHTRAHRGPELSKKCCRRKRQKGKFGLNCEDELLEAAMARARDEEDEFLQAVQQDETMKVRQTEELFRMHQERLGKPNRKQTVL